MNIELLNDTAVLRGKDIRELLKISKSGFTTLIKTGAIKPLPPFKYRFSLSEVERYLNGKH